MMEILDILITGQNGPSGSKLAIFRNKGADQFEEIVDSSLDTLGIAMHPGAITTMTEI